MKRKTFQNDAPSPLSDPNDILRLALQDFLSRGATILTEIVRLSEHIPKEVLEPASYLFAFEEYFSDPERQEAVIHLNSRILALDRLFSSTHREFLERFYFLCMGILKLGQSFNQIVKDLGKGVYISHTLEQVLLDENGKQWLPECLHLLGSSLLLLHEKFPCLVRQRLIVAFYRANKKITLLMKEFDPLMTLFRTLVIPATPHVVNGKQLLVERFHVDVRVSESILNRLQHDDVYNHSRAWPSSEHRSTALSKQAAILFVVLLFCESSLSLLHSNVSDMKDVVDRFFPDSWQFVLCNDFQLDLTKEWFPYYPAAKASLERVLSKSLLLQQHNDQKVTSILSQLDDLLVRGGVLTTEKYVLDHWEELLGLIRSGNVVLRWRMLHAKLWKVSTMHAVGIRLLLGLSRLEDIVRNAIGRILKNKPTSFAQSQSHVSNRLLELSTYFTPHHTELAKWFKQLGEQVQLLRFDHAIVDARRIQHLVRCLEDVEKVDVLEDASLQVKEFLMESRLVLEKMLRMLSVKEECLVHIEIVSDFSYVVATKTMEEFAPKFLWHSHFEHNPHAVSLLPSLLFKLQSVLDQTLCRIVENPASQDMQSVAEFWSKRICACVHNEIFATVPSLVFRELDLLPYGDEFLDPTEGSIVSADLGKYAAGEARYQIQQRLFRISLYLNDILLVSQAVGVVVVNFRKWYLEFLQVELETRMTALMHLSHSKELWKSELLKKAKAMAQLRFALDRVQDYSKSENFMDNNNGVWGQVQAIAWNESISFQNTLATVFLHQVEWTHQADYLPVLTHVQVLIGTSGLAKIVHLMMALVSPALKEICTVSTTSTSYCGVQLNLPLGVIWGSAQWVDSVREARRKYGGLEADLKRMKQLGTVFLAQKQISLLINQDVCSFLPLPLDVENIFLLKSFVLLNEVAKRRSNRNIPLDELDSLEILAGVAWFCKSNPKFASQLDRLAFLSARALGAKSYLERKNAEASLLFKGGNKVALVALERLTQEQAVHRAVAYLSGRLSQNLVLAPRFVETLAKAVVS